MPSWNAGTAGCYSKFLSNTGRAMEPAGAPHATAAAPQGARQVALGRAFNSATQGQMRHNALLRLRASCAVQFSGRTVRDVVWVGSEVHQHGCL